LDIDEELFVYLIDGQKAFDHVTWTKLMQILEGTDIHGRKRRMISKFYLNQSVRLKLVQGETRSIRMEEALDKDAVCH
jgi:hypothetical protein